jgi:hypothetical protein
MVTERHNAAGRMIAKAVSKGAQGGNIVSIDVGCAARVQATGIDTAEMSTRHLPEWLVPDDMRAALRNSGSESRPDMVLVAAHKDAHWTAADKHPSTLEWDQRVVTTVEIKFCVDTSYNTQLEAANAQHTKLHELLTARGSHVSHIAILLGIGGTIYTEHTKQQLAQLGIAPTQLTKLLSKLNRLAATWAGALVSTRRQLEQAVKQCNNTHLVQRAMGRPARRSGYAVDPG